MGLNCAELDCTGIITKDYKKLLYLALRDVFPIFLSVPFVAAAVDAMARDYKHGWRAPILHVWCSKTYPWQCLHTLWWNLQAHLI